MIPATTSLAATSLPRGARRATRAGLLGATALTAVTACAQVGLAQIDLNGLPVTLVYPTDTRSTRQTFGAFEIEVAVSRVQRLRHDQSRPGRAAAHRRCPAPATLPRRPALRARRRHSTSDLMRAWPR